MTYQKVAEMVASIGLPYAYYQFPDGTEQKPPFICFLYPGNQDVPADNTNYQTIKELRVELYTDDKDFDLEKKLEDILRAHDMVYASEEDYIDTEKMYMHVYTMGVVINE